MEPFLGEIRMFGFNFAPRGWALCNGQLLPINQNQALFSLLGNMYGGDGTTTFALPNLQSRVPIHQGQGAELSAYVVGQAGGAETVTLAAAQMPAHSHSVKASSSKANSLKPKGRVPARSQSNTYAARPDTSTVMHPKMIGQTGGGEPHANMQPYLTVNFCIAMVGIFPARDDVQLG
jgi:microcystin-dependent protein